MNNENHFFINYPRKGMKIKSMFNSPKIEVLGFVFCGTWKKYNNEYILTSPNWQDKKGNVISNEQFLSLVLTS